MPEVNELIVKLNLADAQIERLVERIASLNADKAVAERDLRDCRNELCLRCGEYKHAHEGACNGCRWKH